MKKIILIAASIGLLILVWVVSVNRPQTTGNNPTPPAAPGRWHDQRQSPKSDEHQEAYQKLIGLGYLDGYKKATGTAGVTVYNKKAAWSGLNLFTSGHAPEAHLMDMEGTIIHTWSYKKATDIWSRTRKNDPGGYYWRRVHLYANGDILAIYEGIGMIKLDKNSNLIWAYTSKRAPHHDMAVLDNGTIYTLTREWKKVPGVNAGKAFEEFITILSPDGKVIQEYSLLDLIYNSHYARMLDNDSSFKKGGFYGHILHANTLEVFDGSSAHISRIFKKGNVLISILINSTICIVDLETERVVWALGSGMWRHQHQPTLLPGGSMLIFDNKDGDSSSAVKEFGPFSQEILWEYRGATAHPFYSATCGSNQRLPNGNTLITETDNGRAFEVTREGEIVWEYINPFRGGENNELIASLFEMLRINPGEINLNIH